MAADLAIDARYVHKRYGRIAALDGVDLTVPKGSIFGLLGENGAGKTTFIKVLLDIARADSGEVRVLDEPVGSRTARRSIGYLPENLQLPPALSAVGFLRSAGRLKGLSRAQLDDQIPRLLTAVGLDATRWQKRTDSYSKGMRQRTGLAAALLGSPRLLILDEPTDGIDPLGRAQLRTVIQKANRDGATVFLNSHLLAETEKIADRVAVLSHGRVVLSGQLDILRADDRFLVRFRHNPGQEAPEERGFQATDGPLPAADGELWTVFAGDGPEALSAALGGAIADGWVVLEVRPALKDLEAVMAAAVSADVRT